MFVVESATGRSFQLPPTFPQDLLLFTSKVTLLELLNKIKKNWNVRCARWAAGDDGAFAAAQTLTGHTGGVICMIQLDDWRFVSGSFDKTLIVWAKGVRGGADSEWAHQSRVLRDAARRRARREREFRQHADRVGEG